MEEAVNRRLRKKQARWGERIRLGSKLGQSMCSQTHLEPKTPFKSESKFKPLK